MVFRERRPARHRAPDGTHAVGPNFAEDEVTAAEITAEIGSFLDESFLSVEPLPARAGATTLEPGTSPSPGGSLNPGTPADEQGSAPTESLRLRLPTPYAEQLDELALQRGVTPAALLTTWVMERLAIEGRPSTPSPAEKAVPTPRVAPAQRTNPDAPAAGPAREPVPGDTPSEEIASEEIASDELRQPATATWDLGLPDDLASLLSPVDQLNPIGDLAPPSPAAVTPLFRGPPPAHATEEPPKGPRHRAPEPVINLHSRRKI